MIFVGGVSGSGKTTLIDRFCSSNREFRHLRASSVLAEAGRPVKALTFHDALKNQKILLSRILDQPDFNGIMLDGHAVLVLDEDVFNVPNWFFDALPLTAVVCVFDDFDLILGRRKWVGRFSKREGIRWLAHREADLLETHAARAGLPFAALQSAEYDSFESFSLSHDPEYNRLK